MLRLYYILLGNWHLSLNCLGGIFNVCFDHFFVVMCFTHYILKMHIPGESCCYEALYTRGMHNAKHCDCSLLQTNSNVAGQ